MPESLVSKLLTNVALLLTGGLKAAVASISPQRTDLTDSRLYDSIVSETDGETFLRVLAADYILYIDTGRRPKSKLVPFAALLDWIKRKGINKDRVLSDQELAKKIQWGIFHAGIAARPFLARYLENATATLEVVFGKEFQILIESELLKRLKP